MGGGGLNHPCPHEICFTAGETVHRPGGPHLRTLNLGIQLNGSLCDLDGPLLWQRQGS
jgi:hypothetical protein